jgi:hypothetical protein
MQLPSTFIQYYHTCVVQHFNAFLLCPIFHNQVYKFYVEQNPTLHTMQGRICTTFYIFMPYYY